MDSAVNPVVKLWVNGAAVVADGASLVVDPVSGAWELRATLPAHNPFRQRFGLSMQLADGRTAHGEARLADAAGEVVVFEGTERLEGAL
jgi:hypothetical protein